MTIVYPYGMRKQKVTQAHRQALIVDIAAREKKAHELSEEYGYSIEVLKAFVLEHKQEIELAREALEEENPNGALDVVTPQQLSELWISNKFARLKRYEMISNRLFNYAMTVSPDAVILREFRFYQTAAANELGQLLHRGAGEQADGDKLTVEFGVDPANFE